MNLTKDRAEGKTSHLYPRAVWEDPIFTLELLAAIRYRLRMEIPLERQDTEYLCDAIGDILGDRLTENQKAARKNDPQYDETQDAAKRAAKALYLVRPRGQKSNPFSRRNVNIYNCVQEWIGKGQTAHGARMKATVEYHLTEKAIEKICAKIDQSIARSKAKIATEN